MFKVFVLLCTCWCLIKLSFEHCEESNINFVSVILTCVNGTQSFPNTTKTVLMLRCLDCNIPLLDEKTILKKFDGDAFNMSNSHVQVISAGAFKQFRRSMRRFLFQNNEVNYIAPKTFSNFTILEEINFRNCRIAQLEPDVFNGTTTTHLDLSQNLLTNISKTLDGLKVLMLNLSSNRIKNIPEDSFDKVTFNLGRFYTEFSVLDLSNNVIQRIYPNTFKTPERTNSIVMLTLSKNLITTIESKTFLKTPFLRILVLNQNLISQLATDSFKGLTNLVSLDLQRNHIQKIPTSLFADLQKLEFLDLSQNYLTAIDSTTFSGLINLKGLNMSHNNLKTFDDVQLFPLVGLISLDISDVRIHTINLKSILQHHWRLKILVLNDNFWTCKQLTKMYKQLSRQFNGFNFPAQHFDVSNLHGIACSKDELKSYDTLTFDDFYNIIAQESIDPNSFIDDDLPINKIMENVIKNIAIVKSMSIIIAIVLIVLFLQFIVRSILMCLKQYNIVNKTKFSFFYNQDQDTVKVLP
ncbi:hypothetical protein RN001_000995 [Aquatica leii]|uniref:Uncharacterized protein n=1 Tax=Aquatica leii TaxID=1421715 RepID=A0AAN7PFM1_9COLE|nr:hypothetical protein RN001_000995 [Aquatica leii]